MIYGVVIMYDVSWLVRNKVLLIRAEDEVTPAELKSGLSLMHVMVMDSDETVHCITDSRNLKKYPLKFSTLLRAEQKQDYSGWTIHIDSNPMGRRLTDMVTQMTTGQKVKTFPSITRAIKFLQQEDHQLTTMVDSAGAGV